MVEATRSNMDVLHIDKVIIRQAHVGQIYQPTIYNTLK